MSGQGIMLLNYEAISPDPVVVVVINLEFDLSFDGLCTGSIIGNEFRLVAVISRIASSLKAPSQYRY